MEELVKPGEQNLDYISSCQLISEAENSGCVRYLCHLANTNKSVKDWAEVMAGDEVMTTALLDRLLHRCHVFNIKGRSYRLRDLERSLKH